MFTKSTDLVGVLVIKISGNIIFPLDGELKIVKQLNTA